MIDLQRGSIEVDGIDLTTLQCTDVRSCLNVIPQEPFFMPGTLRFNLDRCSATSPVSDACLIAALETVGLWKKVVSSGDEGLNQVLSISNWSLGERQLLALARALLMQSPILVLDEAASRYVVGLDHINNNKLDSGSILVLTGKQKPLCRPSLNRSLHLRQSYP